MRFEMQSSLSKKCQHRDVPEMGGFGLMLKSQTTGLQWFGGRKASGNWPRYASHLVRTRSHFGCVGIRLKGRKGSRSDAPRSIMPNFVRQDAATCGYVRLCAAMCGFWETGRSPPRAGIIFTTESHGRKGKLAERAAKSHVGEESRVAPAKWPSDMIHWINRFERYSKPMLMTLTLALLAIIGWVDWRTGYELSIFVFYLIPVALAVWFVGDKFGIITTSLCVIVWVLADWKAGAQYGPFIVVWNALIAAVSLFVVTGLLARLRKSQRELEERVRQRTVALTNEINERARLEQELLHISEREQRRIGHDLHDSLGQHLTGTALAGHVLGEKLAEKSLPEAAAANHVVKLVEEAIDLTRTLARGLHPVDLEGENFLDSFGELAANVSERFKIRCRFECSPAPRIRPPEGAIHLYRIAQEAINNAIKHGKAKEITIRLEKMKNVLTLSVEDDGGGFSESARSGPGMGLRIMAYRASVIGGTFSIAKLPQRGTRATCALPVEREAAKELYAAKK